MSLDWRIKRRKLVWEPLRLEKGTNMGLDDGSWSHRRGKRNLSEPAYRGAIPASSLTLLATIHLHPPLTDQSQESASIGAKKISLQGSEGWGISLITNRPKTCKIIFQIFINKCKKGSFISTCGSKNRNIHTTLLTYLAPTFFHSSKRAMNHKRNYSRKRIILIKEISGEGGMEISKQVTERKLQSSSHWIENKASDDNAMIWQRYLKLLRKVSFFAVMFQAI